MDYLSSDETERNTALKLGESQTVCLLKCSQNQQKHITKEKQGHRNNHY